MAIEFVYGKGAYPVFLFKRVFFAAIRIVNTFYLILDIKCCFYIINGRYFVYYFNISSFYGGCVSHVYAITVFVCLVKNGYPSARTEILLQGRFITDEFKCGDKISSVEYRSVVFVYFRYIVRNICDIAFFYKSLRLFHKAYFCGRSSDRKYG